MRRKAGCVPCTIICFRTESPWAGIGILRFRCRCSSCAPGCYVLTDTTPERAFCIRGLFFSLLRAACATQLTTRPPPTDVFGPVACGCLVLAAAVIPPCAARASPYTCLFFVRCSLLSPHTPLLVLSHAAFVRRLRSRPRIPELPWNVPDPNRRTRLSHLTLYLTLYLVGAQYTPPTVLDGGDVPSASQVAAACP